MSEFTAPSSYKSYDELKGRLEVVLGQSTGAGATVKNDSLTQTAEVVSAREQEPQVIASAPEPNITAAADEDDTLSYFAKLAAED